MRRKFIKLDVFEAELFIFWDAKPLEVRKYVQKNLKNLPKHVLNWLEDRNDNPPAGVCISDPGVSAHCLIWLAKPPHKNFDVFIHEVGHAVFRIMKHWDIDVDENSQEIVAMLNGYIVKEFLKSR